MTTTSPPRYTAQCACGTVRLRLAGEPIATLICYCDDCQQAAQQIAEQGGPPLLEADSGTQCALFRKDHLVCEQGAEWLQAHRLRETSQTRRMVARCCHTPMFAGFDGAAHWVTVFARRLAPAGVPMQMRLNLKFKPASVSVPDDMPNYATFPLRFIARLMLARVAMWLGK